MGGLYICHDKHNEGSLVKLLEGAVVSLLLSLRSDWFLHEGGDSESRLSDHWDTFNSCPEKAESATLESSPENCSNPTMDGS